MALRRAPVHADFDDATGKIQNFVNGDTSRSAFTSSAYFGRKPRQMGRAVHGFSPHDSFFGAPNYTFHTLFKCPFPYYALQFYFQNIQGAAVTIDNHCFAPTANATTKTNPTGAWVDGPAVVVIPAGSVQRPGRVLTAKTEVASIAPNDGQSWHWLMARACSVLSNQPYIAPNIGTEGLAGWDAANPNYPLWSENKAGNLASVATAGPGTGWNGRLGAEAVGLPVSVSYTHLTLPTRLL
jgi:hypothetical protein